MESSKVFGDTEECHSSESGWTMYIGSPVHADDWSGASDVGDHADDYDLKNHHHEDDSDDSMASDASSVPIHQGVVHFKHGDDKDDGDDDDGGGKYSLERKTNEQMKKQKAERVGRKNEKEERVFMAKTATNDASAQSGSKVRKSIWMGKRK